MQHDVREEGLSIQKHLYHRQFNNQASAAVIPAIGILNSSTIPPELGLLRCSILQI
jgi:hypothetical protein